MKLPGVAFDLALKTFKSLIVKRIESIPPKNNVQSCVNTEKLGVV